jgi:hypothetical protein
MPTRRGPLPKPPSLKPEKAIPVLEEHIRFGEGNLWPERYDSPKRSEWAVTGEGALVAALGSEDHAVQAFRLAQCGSYGPDDTDERLQQQATRQLNEMISVLRSAVQQLRWQLPDPHQVFVPSGSQHDAYVQIRSIIQQAKTEIFIIDPWVDETLWPLLTNVPRSCKVRILGEHLKGDFTLEAGKFAAQHGTSIEVRTTAKYHDRFIFLDGKRCFHLGASIKDAGNKGFALSEFERPQLVTATLADAEAEWISGTLVQI